MGYVESLELEAPGTLSSVGWEVVRVQVVVARALRQAVVPVQKGFWLLHRFQVVGGLVGFCLEQAVGTVGAEIHRVVRRTVLTVPSHPLYRLHAADITLVADVLNPDFVLANLLQRLFFQSLQL